LLLQSQAHLFTTRVAAAAALEQLLARVATAAAVLAQ
jgi:hypothetical protein